MADGPRAPLEQGHRQRRAHAPLSAVARTQSSTSTAGRSDASQSDGQIHETTVTLGFRFKRKFLGSTQRSEGLHFNEHSRRRRRPTPSTNQPTIDEQKM